MQKSDAMQLRERKLKRRARLVAANLAFILVPRGTASMQSRTNRPVRQELVGNGRHRGGWSQKYGYPIHNQQLWRLVATAKRAKRLLCVLNAGCASKPADF